MIEFKGYINDSAKACIYQSIKKTSIKFGVFYFVTLIPGTIGLSYMLQTPIILIIHTLLSILFSILFFVSHKSQNARKTSVEARIYFDDENIVYESSFGDEIRSIYDVKTVREYDDFYELEFPLIKTGISLVCQKNLLTNGSLQEFEILFGEKLQQIENN